ncbi:MAG: DUF2726 domain-containing protein [Candidatus Moranbacteria bacterium]|nr:DUF2726 domain-containing protein [Candidatus Moranbacteria bacterium]
MTKSIFYLILILGVFALFKFFLEKYFSEKKKIYTYRSKESFMTSAEREFFGVLKSAIGEKYQIFAQVHLPTILDCKINGQNWHGAFRHIDEKSVDFVLCDSISLKPLLAIELDDKSHDEESRQLRDEEVERIFKEANLPLLRFENHGQYDQAGIARRIDEVLDVTKLA